MIDLEKKVHTCQKCKNKELGSIVPYPPVYSFGNPQGKQIMVVGQNPSSREYINGFLTDNPNAEMRRQSQLTYFDKRNYLFFNELERFFEGKVREKIQWVDSPWEKVGYLDIVKCPTRPLSGQGQWSELPLKIKHTIMSNCEHYLIEQLMLYRPRIIIAYGVDVGKWFSKYFKLLYKGFETVTTTLESRKIALIFIPQRQGPHSKPEVMWTQDEILNSLMAFNVKFLQR